MLHETQQIKFVFIGPCRSGKSSLVLRLSGNKCGDDYQPTIGVAFKTSSYETWNKQFRITLWDASGDPHFDHITKVYLHGAHIVFACVDLFRDF